MTDLAAASEPIKAAAAVLRGRTDDADFDDAVADLLDALAKDYDETVQWNAERDADPTMAWAREKAYLPDLTRPLAVAAVVLSPRAHP